MTCRETTVSIMIQALCSFLPSSNNFYYTLIPNIKNRLFFHHPSQSYAMSIPNSELLPLSFNYQDSYVFLDDMIYLEKDAYKDVVSKVQVLPGLLLYSTPST